MNERINWSIELLNLCVKYHQMFEMEQYAKRAEDENSRLWYTEAYQLSKELFDEQREKVESLLKKSFEAGMERKYPNFEDWLKDMNKIEENFYGSHGEI